MKRGTPTCPKCGKRMAKRWCPALGTKICQLCCGRLREKELHCPPACPHLAAHRSYQERRIVDRNPAATPPAGERAHRDVEKDERLSWLAFNVAAALHGYAEANPAFTDRDAILALEYARGRVEKGVSRLIIPGDSLRPTSEAGETLLQAVETCRWQPGGLILSSSDAYTREDKTAVLDRMGFEARALAGEARAGRLYLGALASRLAKAGRESAKNKLVTLT